MRCEVLPEALRPELARAAKVATKDLMSVTAYVELYAVDGGLSLRAQDMHVNFVSRVAAQVQDSGSALVECGRLVSVLGVRPDGVPLQLRVVGNQLHIKQGEFHAKLALFRHGAMDTVDFGGPFSLDMEVQPDVFYGMLRCRWSVDDEEATFAGMLLDFSEAGILRVAAFTRALLQVAHFRMADMPTYRIVLAPQIIPLLESMPKDKPFRLAYSAEQAKVYLFSQTFAARIACAEDRFPLQYQHVLGLYRWEEGVYPVPFMNSAGKVASEFPRTQIVFNRHEVLAAIESVLVVLDKEDQTVAMKIGQKLEDGQIVVEFSAAGNVSKSTAAEKVLARGDIDSAMELGLNHASVRGALRRLGEDDFVLHVGRKDDSIVITEKGSPHIVALATLMRL